MGLTIISPGLFLLSLSFDLLFFNFAAASWLLINDGIPAMVMMYMIYMVYSLYLEMAVKETPLTNDVEHAG